LGVLSQFYNISGLLFSLIPIGTMGLLKYFSLYTSENKPAEANYLFRFFLIINLPLVIIISTFFLIFSGSISYLLFSDPSYSKSIILYSFAVPVGLFASLMDTYFKGIRNTKYYVLYSILNSIFGFIIFLILLLLYKYEGVIISISVSMFFGLIVGSVLLKKIGKLPKLSNVVKVDNEIIKKIIGLGIVMMILSAIQQIALLFVRTTLAIRLGMHDVGIFQSVFGISNNYFAFFIGILGIYSIPLISTHKTKKETVDEINRTLRLLLVIYTPLIILCFVLRYLILITFYSKAFLSAGDILFFQLLGDFIKAISWVFGLWLIPYVKIKYLLIFEIINNFVFISVFYYLLTYKFMGLQSASIGYMSAFIGHFILNLIFLKKGIDFKFAERNLYILVVSFLIIIAVFVLSYYNYMIGYYIVLPSLLVWVILCIQKKDYIHLKQLFLDIMKIKK
jgi:O-antigen/teichoic acid export membrane protein